MLNKLKIFEYASTVSTSRLLCVVPCRPADKEALPTRRTDIAVPRQRGGNNKETWMTRSQIPNSVIQHDEEAKMTRRICFSKSDEEE